MYVVVVAVVVVVASIQVKSSTPIPTNKFFPRHSSGNIPSTLLKVFGLTTRESLL